MTQPIQDSNLSPSPWRTPHAIAAVLYCICMTVVGLWVPDNILKDNNWARDFSNFMAGIVPQIDRITALNIKPDVNRFYFSVLWAGSPALIIIIIFAVFDGWKKQSAPMWWLPFHKAIWLFLFGSLVVWATLDVTTIIDPAIKLAKFNFGTALGRAVIGQIFVVGPLFFSIGILACALGWITGYIPRNIKLRAKP